MELREARDPSDVRGAMRAHARAWRAAYADILPESVLEGISAVRASVIRDRYEAVHDHPGYRVAVEDGRVLGYVFVRWRDTKPFVPADAAGLKELYVDPDWWGEGVGTALLERGTAAIPADRQRLVLETFEANDIGRGFYEARGFEAVGRSTIELAGASYPVVIYGRPH